MANIKSQKKRNLQNETRRVRNKGVRSELKTRVKVADAGIASGAEDAAELVRVAQKRLGKAASKGVIHKNAAARRQSRLMRRASTRFLSLTGFLRFIGGSHGFSVEPPLVDVWCRRVRAASRATSTSITVRSSIPPKPRRSSSARASSCIASRSPLVPSRFAASSGNRAPPRSSSRAPPPLAPSS